MRHSGVLGMLHDFITPDNWEHIERRGKRATTAWHRQARNLAYQLFDRCLQRHWVTWAIDSLRKRPTALLQLDDLVRPHASNIYLLDGVQEVPISQITGSEGRAQDFDRHFIPTSAHLRERWVTMATLLDEGHVLPPVELVKVGQDYYVLDGHHRISVAKAYNRETIEAHVTVWALPESVQAMAPSPLESTAAPFEIA